MSKTKHILAKVFYPIIIIATDIEVRFRLSKDYPSRLKCYFDKVFGDEDEMLSSDRMGYCVDFWILKKELLKKRYNIEWKTPMDKHPGTRYD